MSSAAPAESPAAGAGIGRGVPARGLADRYVEVRALTEQLAQPLSAEDQTVQSMPDASPTKWHRAHTTWFFETLVLEQAFAGYRPFDPAYGYLFNSYYEALGPRHPRPERGVISRPGIAEVAGYRAYVDYAMANLLSSCEEPSVLDMVELGIHHEQQHQELLLMDAKHMLSRNPMQPAYATLRSEPPGEAPPMSWAHHSGGVYQIGHSGSGFAFDNELPRHQSMLEPFELASRTVTCGEWAEFIADGGYQRPELWLSDGWAAVRTGQWQAPLYWSGTADGWTVFTLGGARGMNPAEPVCDVSYYEADAFARWAGARLPSEAEWEVGAEGGGVEGNMLDTAVLHPLPARAGQSIFGDVWQWTSSAYGPYPGFHPAPGLPSEYNGKFMVSQQVLRGGCCATPAGHLRATYRNFFPPGARWAFSGLRLARDA